LAIHPFFLLLPILTGALMLIPGWLYLLVLMYFSFITVPNVFANYKVSNDLMLSVLMPVKKKEIIGARMISILILEVLHIGIAVIYALINRNIYDATWFLFIQPNIAYFGLAFIMFGLFNLVLFPIYFTTGYKYGFATVAAITVMVIFGGMVEYVAFRNRLIHDFLRGSGDLSGHILFLGIGVLLFVMLAFLAYSISVDRFKKVDI
jgi:hypothetical protein